MNQIFPRGIRRIAVGCFVVLLAGILVGCGQAEQSPSSTEESLAPARESQEAVEGSTTDRLQPKEIPAGMLTEGTVADRGFTLDNVYHSENAGDIHYHVSFPDGYDESTPVALFITLPGWEGLYFQGVGANMVEPYPFVANDYIADMIVVAPQLNDWGQTSAEQTVVLTEFFLEYYPIDETRVFIEGFSGGGETLSLVLDMRPELYAAALHIASRWDGGYETLTQTRTPLRFAIGENDSYYGSEPVKRAYEGIRAEYEAKGLSAAEIDTLLVLDVRDHSFFTAAGYSDEHAGSMLFAYDEETMEWLFSQRKALTSEGDETVFVKSSYQFPEELEVVPAGYFSRAQQEGTLVDLYYDTWESFSYEQRFQPLRKRAVVYLPYGYDESKRYPVLYLMHGGWSDETVYMGSEGNPARFKFVMDHAIQDGLVEPMIVVNPTYNNTSGSDSGDYSLAIQLTDRYHQELVNDLIPAVEGTYSSYAQTTDLVGIAASRDHRAFMGFSMGSVTTWRTFEYSLPYFRYFFPSSGNLGTNGRAMAQMVQTAGMTSDDFFIFAATGTDDFAYSAFRAQIAAMAAVDDGTFVLGRSEAEGNLWYLEQEGGTHSGEYAMQYFYNGIRWLWK